MSSGVVGTIIQEQAADTEEVRGVLISVRVDSRRSGKC